MDIYHLCFANEILPFIFEVLNETCAALSKVNSCENPFQVSLFFPSVIKQSFLAPVVLRPPGKFANFNGL